MNSYIDNHRTNRQNARLQANSYNSNQNCDDINQVPFGQPQNQNDIMNWYHMNEITK